MQYRTLGRTGLKVGEIGMGTFKTFDVVGRAGEARCRRVVDAALAHGINFFDTAPMYGESERVLGLALSGRRGKAILATKVLERDARAARASIERSLRRLQTEVIDLLQIHNMSAWQEVTPLLQEYRAKGAVRFLGVTDYRVSNFPEVIRAMETGLFDTVQIPFFLGEAACRRRLLPLAQEMNIGVIGMTPFRPTLARASLLEPLSKKDLSFLAPFGVRTPGGALLKWVLSEPRLAATIPATSKPERVAENAAVSDGKPLPKEVLEELEGLVG